jgi:nitrogen regulatory protein P-II 1
MKKIEAIIRSEKLDDVMSRLKSLGYPGMTITEVRGHGKQGGMTQMWRGTEYRVEYLAKLKLEVVVLDEDVGRVASSIVAGARTGRIGDGKVFISDIEDAIRIRTGDYGDNAI